MLSPKLRVLKTWVSQDHSLIFQCQTSSESLPKKVHLVLDLKQNSFGARLQVDKPGDATANHAFIQILRKHCPNFTIKEIRCESESGDIWIPLLAGTDHGHFWQLRLVKSRPPLASLLSPELLVHVSHGQKGTFTKKHALEGPPPSGPFVDLLPDLLGQLQGHETEPNHDQDEELRDATDSSPASKPQKELRARLKRKMKTIVKTLDKLRRDLPPADRVKDLELKASLLQSYSYLVRPDSISLELDEALTGLDAAISIELDPELSRGQQIERAFQLVHKVRRGRDLGQKQIEQAETQRIQLQEDIAFLEGEERSPLELAALTRRYQLPDLQRPAAAGEVPVAKPFKTYTASSGHKLLVGKGAHENDALTKSARSNDYWFHAVGVTGSHVILPVTADIRTALPPTLQREAAILALHFSKFKEDLGGECYVTRKAQLKKPKGMPPGLWQINKSESVFYRYSAEELQRLLQTIEL